MMGYLGLLASYFSGRGGALGLPPSGAATMFSGETGAGF